MKILVVDNEESILLALKEFLTKEGYEVLFASVPVHYRKLARYAYRVILLKVGKFNEEECWL